MGRGYYSFPARPFPAVFSINILFTIILLPMFSFFIIYLFRRLRKGLQLLVSISISVLIAIGEHFAELLGLFIHANTWNHSYSIIGYFLFIWVIWLFYRWVCDQG
ncbi:hypothetical protein JOC48_001077 [Aquibacillus albus]|uniref:Uncharacterized protein n=1 Tax=Aquibacillus albus TaxID=1168171 RepID=A0ABS2MXL8_9BACI|nr:CBO0543 family protein [Aquibacillus albus]MBM7570599.1 hypothetical protein [Aquibacillus albus]